MATVKGTNFSDSIGGRSGATNDSDSIWGYEGNDTIHALGGDDFV